MLGRTCPKLMEVKSKLSFPVKSKNLALLQVGSLTSLPPCRLDHLGRQIPEVVMLGNKVIEANPVIGRHLEAASLLKVGARGATTVAVRAT